MYETHENNILKLKKETAKIAKDAKKILDRQK